MALFECFVIIFVIQLFRTGGSGWIKWMEIMENVLSQGQDVNRPSARGFRSTDLILARLIH